MTETGEQRARRRRWLNLAELVAVAGVVIAGLGLYLTWSDRREARQEKATTEARAARPELTATRAGDGRILRLTDGRRELSEISIAFPKALGLAPARPAGEPVIAADLFAAPLLRLTDGGPDERTGRLPVLITARYADDDGPQTATGLYDVVWATHGRLGRGRALTLTGLRPRQHGANQAALDAAWAREKP